MTATNTYGRQVVVPLTNKSGGSVAAGDVVVVDTTNNDAFTTSTAGAVTGTVGIAQETIANNATGRVLLSGYAALVNTSASVTRGNFGKTHTVAKQAIDAGGSRTVGTFCQFLTGGTTPDAVVWPVDLGAAGGTSLTVSENRLGADTTLTANTYGDGPSQSLAAGTYLLDGHCEVTTVNTGWITVKLMNGATAIDSSEGFQTTATAGLSMNVSGYVVLGSLTTVKIQAAETGAGGGTIKATPGTNATGLSGTGSYLRAVKIA
jgi:hypothetical protein